MKRPCAGMSPKPKAPETPPSMPGEVSLVKAEPGVAAKAKVKSEPLPPIPKPDAVAMAKKLKRLAEKGESDLPDMYKKCKAQQEKRDFFYNTYSLDPSVSSKGVQKLDEDMQTRKSTEKPGWYTKEQVAESKGILSSNPRFVELCDASVAGLKERPHEDPALAALDVKQYRYTIKTFEMVKTEKKGLKLQESVDNVEEHAGLGWRPPDQDDHWG